MAMDYMMPIAKDVGLVYTPMMCGSTSCPTTNLNGASQYMAYMGNRDVRRILMGFALPEGVTDASTIQSCTLQLPAPMTSGTSVSSYTMDISNALTDFDPMTVTANTAPKLGNTVASFTAKDNTAPPAVDITDACRAAVNGYVDIMLDSRGSPVTFPSSSGGSNAMLMMTTM
ncbi:hypothetical protein GQ54DRAFT_312091 [Martensiomyces pterosporus]|nr:hypothetical protein GQ54DRAFT_312091 [Martensiomyces pterosporus]